MSCLSKSSSLTAAMLLVALASPAYGASSYFSLQGNLNALGDQYDIKLDLSRSVGSGEDLRFLTWGVVGGTFNAAGDAIVDTDFDGDLRLFDSGNNLRGQADEQIGNYYDALLSWAGVQTDPNGVPLNPDPLPAGAYRLNVQQFSNSAAKPFAVDLIGPSDAIVFTGGSPVNSATVNSLKFGSNDGGTAIYNHTPASGSFNLLGDLVVANTGNAQLNQTDGTISVGGLTRVKSGGVVTLTAGTFNATGGLLIEGGTFTRNLATFNMPTAAPLTVSSGGLFNASPPNAGGNTNGTNGPSMTNTGNWQIGGGTVRLNGGRGGDGVPNPFSQPGRPGGAGGVLTVNSGGLIDLFGSGQITLNGGDAGAGSVFDPGGVGGQGGQFIMNGGTTTLLGTSSLLVNGGVGGKHASFTSKSSPGGTGGHATLAGGSLVLSENSAVRVEGGLGGPLSFFSAPGANGGTGGIFEVSGGNVQVNDAATLSVRGGAGQQGGQGNVGGTGGTGGEVKVTAGILTLNNGLITSAGGAAGAAGSFGSPGQPGAPGQFNITGGSFIQNAGEVFTGSFSRSGAGVFTFNNGKLTVSTGTFNPNAVDYNLNGPTAAELPTLVLEKGATAPGITGVVHVGNTTRGRLELRSGAALTNTEADLGNLAGSSGEALVDGAGTLWKVTDFLDLAVGESGTGTLTVSNGGKIEALSDFVLGRNATGNGAANFNSGGIVSATAGIWIGESGTGHLTAGTNSVLTSLFINLAYIPTASGTLDITGQGASVTVTNEIALRNASATINLSNGTLKAGSIQNSNGGAFNFTGGTLSVGTFTGSLNQQGGTLSPGSSPGTTTVTGNYTMNAASKLKIELGGTTPGTEHDKVQVNDSTTLAGTLDLSIINGYVPAPYSTYTILNSNNGLGGSKFSAVTGRFYATDRALFVSYSTDSVAITEARKGDLDLDNDVDDADFGIAFAAFTGPGSSPSSNVNADLDGDGDVDDADFGIAFAAFTGPGGPAVVPEPATLSLLAVAGLIGLRRRRR